MKPIIAISLIATLAFGLGACQDKGASAGTNSPEATAQQQQSTPKQNAAAQETAHKDETFEMGKQLVADADCMRCHAPGTKKPFDRNNSKVHDFGSLSTMVEACNTTLSIGWFPEEVHAVAHYLNQTYYHFPE